MDKIDVEELKKQISTDVAVSMVSQLVEDVTERCYSLCIKKPGTALDNYEQRCLSNCMDRFIDSYNIVSRTLMSKIENEQQ